MTFDDVKREVASLRRYYGSDCVTDATLSEDGTVASYTVQPGTPLGYRQQYNLVTGQERHCGLGRGCFWTDWE